MQRYIYDPRNFKIMESTEITDFLVNLTPEQVKYLGKRDDIQWNTGFDTARIYEEHKAHDGVCSCADRQANLLETMDRKLMKIAKLSEDDKRRVREVWQTE